MWVHTKGCPRQLCPRRKSLWRPPDEEAVPEVVPEIPEPEVVPVRKPRAKAAVRRDAPPPKAPKKLDLKQKHECGACGRTMNLHTALYGHKNCPGEVSIPPPPALTRQVAVKEEPPPAPAMSQPQMLRFQLAQAAQERRAQQHLRMINPIRQFYGLGA